MNKILLLTLTVIPILLQAQQFDCETILTEPLAINNCSPDNHDSCVIYDLERIYDCVDFSPIDKFVFEPVVIATQLYSRIGKDSLTYKDVFSDYNALLASEVYAKMKEFQLSLRAYEKLKVDEENWELFSDNLRKAGYTNSELDSLKQIFRPVENSSITFLDAFVIAKNPSHKVSSSNSSTVRNTFETFEDIELTLEIALRKNKPALIYFVDLVDLPSQRFTRTVLETDQNLEILNSDFDPYYAFTHKTSEFNIYEKIARGLDIGSTISKGSYAINIKNKLTSEETSTPLIVILNEDGAVRTTFSQTDKSEELTEFLKENKNVR